MPLRRLQGSLVVALAALAVLPAVAQGSGEFEPNDALISSAGPMAGGLNYDATMETDNDHDWYRFYTKTTTQLDIAITALHPDWSGCAEFTLRDANGVSLNSYTDALYNRVSHIYETVPTGLYYIEVDPDCGGNPVNRYRFSLAPATSITANEVCGQTYIIQRDAIRAIKKAKLRISKVRKRFKRRQLRAEIRQAKATIAGAQAVLAQGC